MRRGGGGRGGGGRGGGGYGRRDARPGGGASRDDRDRRPDYRSRRTPSPGRRPRRPRGEDDDRDRDRDPPRGGRTGYGSGGRSPPRRERADCGDRHQSPRRGRVEHEDSRDPLGRGPRDYGGDRRGSPRGRREYGRDPDVSPRGLRDYGRVAYRGERDRYDRPNRDGGSGSGYDAPPSYMLPDHPSDLGRPSHDRSAGSGHRSAAKDGDLYGGGMTLKISSSGLGRTSTMYPQDPRSSSPLLRSPPTRTVLSPPPLYPSVPPETGFLTGESSMKAGDGFGAGSKPLLHDDGHFKYHKHSHDLYSESRGIERHYSGSRDVAVEKDGRTERFYSSGDGTTGRDRETGRFYSSRDVLESDMVKALGDSSSALLAKDHPQRMYTGPGYESSNGYIMDGLGRSPHGSLGHGSGHPHRLSGSSLDHGSGHGDETLLDIARRTHSKHTPRAASMEYGEHAEYVGRDPINDAYTAPENLRGNVSLNSRHISGSASFRGVRNERVNNHTRLSHMIEEDDCSFEAMHKETELIPHFRDDDSIQYPTRGGNGRYSHSPGTEPIRTVRRSAHQDDFCSIENLSDQETYHMVSRKRYRSPAFDHEVDLADDGFAGLDPYDDMDAYDLPPPRMPMFDNDMVDDVEYDERYDMPANQTVFSRLALPDETYGYGHSKDRPMSQRLSRPNSYSQFGGVSMNGRGRGRGRGLTKSAKKRLRTAPHEFHGEYPSDRNECVRPNKYSKSSEDDPIGSEVKNEDAPEYEDLLRKDPPEGSEEFRKQVDQAFLKYTKMLNESSAMQKKYREASKGSLSCSVCGSVARKFPDLDALVSHAYDTCKTGLRTKHLGFHRALCILMGWNWQVAPDTSKAHHSISSEQLNAMRGDLMLWPPVIVIHNSSIVNKAKDIEAKVVSVEEIEGVLAEIGIPLDKAKVSQGRPANQSVFLVKFKPTISGFQEAMRTHDHFSTRNHGKEEFQQMRDGKGKKAAPTDSLEELLYGHVAVGEDLVYLDEGTKKRCIIRSKMEIEANADATLNLEP
ncbi:hypothetical protein U9M48_035101 [Paspalum notatum var. saurae]|uniref:XS domain-containing protein n=1 Tax=Paspalum notatum var. saurae TaxID=547442 RepID=A0AAQ3X8L7_PASNO